MKKCLLVIAAMALVMLGCTDQQFLNETADKTRASAQVSEIEMLKEQARWGDGQAYLKLADCYRDGRGVEKDFISMLNMVALADQYGGIKRMEDYLETMPANSEFKLIVDAVELYEKKQVEESKAMTELLIAQGSPDGYSVKSIIAVESGDTLEGKRLMEQAASQGSTFAELLLCIPDWRGATNPDVEKLKALADRVPFACQLLADMYTGSDNASLKDERLAAYYYMKADEQACLSRRGARWLLNYYRNGGQLQISVCDIQRLQKLADEEPVEEQDAVVDTVVAK